MQREAAERARQEQDAQARKQQEQQRQQQAEQVRRQQEQQRQQQADQLRRQREQQQQARQARRQQEQEQQRQRQANIIPQRVENLDDLRRVYIAPLNQILAQNVTLARHFNKILESLTQGAGDIILRTSIAKQLKTRIEFWDRGLYTAVDLANLEKDAKSSKRMIEKVLGNAVVPLVEQIPERLRINRRMVNSPYLDMLFAQQAEQMNIQNIEVEPNEQVLEQALTKIGNLFDRLVTENKLTPIRLLDYTGWDNDDLRAAYDKTGNQYNDFVDFVRARHPEQYNGLPFAKKTNLVGTPMYGGGLIGGIFNHSARTKNRAIALANHLIWTLNENGQEVQNLSDDDAVLMLSRLAIGGRRCNTRAEEDTAWAVMKGSNRLAAEGNDLLEIKLASFMLLLKKQAVDNMIEADYRGNHNVHFRTLIEKHLAPHIGWTPGTENFEEVDHWNEFTRLPIAQGLDKFYTHFTPALIEDALIRDITKGTSREQDEATIKMADLNAYVERMMPEGRRDPLSAALLDEAEDEINYVCTRQNVRTLLYRAGYYEADD